MATGFKHLVEHTRHLEPTVLVVGYGTNESFEGKKGLAKFVTGLNTLLDALAPTRAKMVLLSPLRQGTMPRPLPDPAKNNENLHLYADAIRDVARKRGAIFIDLYDRLGDPGKVPGVTGNGIHLTGHGYQWSAPALLAGLGLPPRGPRLTLSAADFPYRPAKDEPLPLAARTLIVEKLPLGKHTLSVDGQAVATADAKEWARGVKLERGPEFEQVEKLRKTIVAKNQLYFHRWRPQNETYLFGFRKHEQGKNAVEVPKFDPLVAAKEKEILTLSKPVEHVCTMRPAR